MTQTTQNVSPLFTSIISATKAEFVFTTNHTPRSQFWDREAILRRFSSKLATALLKAGQVLEENGYMPYAYWMNRDSGWFYWTIYFWDPGSERLLRIIGRI